MAAKGSKYARKHFVEAASGSNTETHDSKIETDNAKILEVIYDDLTFLETFDTMTLDEQVKTYQLLNTLAADNDDAGLSAISKFKIDQILRRIQLEIKEGQRFALSKDEHHLIRMDCYGTIDKRQPHQLSSYYTNLKKRRLKETLPPEAYQFDTSPAWKLFRQFRSFRGIERRLQHYMSKMRYRPEILSVMGVQDFSDLIFNASRITPSDKRVQFSPNNRSLFVRDLAIRKGQEIKQILESRNVDKRYISSLLNAMKLFGVTNKNRIIITETYFTKRVLRNLKRAGIPCEQYHEGGKIPQPLIDTLMFDGRGKLVEARDETGALLNVAQYPSFQLHHKVAVSEGGRLPQISKVNYKDNYMLVPEEIHAFVLHGNDKRVSQYGKEAYVQRMEFTNPNLSFMYDLRPDSLIEFDWTKTKAYQELEEEDAEYTVNYDEVMLELSDKRQEMNKTKSIEDMDLLVTIIRQKHGLRKIR